MKRELVNFIAVIGLVLLGAAVVLGLLTGILFIFPNSSIMGAKAVNERDTQIVYRDTDLETAFANGKFIIESSGTQIEVQMTNDTKFHGNTIVVNESATGVAFNSLNRTLIEWTKTLYGEDDELYYRIKILEPSGMIFTQKPTTVYINLPRRTDDFKYDFVLQNQYSNVNFSFADNTPSATDKLLIDDLIIESAASVNIPYYENNSVNNIMVKGNNTKLTCHADVKNNVTISGANNSVNVGNGELAGIVGNLTITGENNHINGTKANGVRFKANNGSLNMSQTIATLNVETVNATISVNQVSGSLTMKTQVGSLQAQSVGNGLTFNAGTTDAPYATASVNVGSVSGTTVVKNYGVGSIDLNNVNGNISVESYQVGGGAINVGFLNGGSAHETYIHGYDGDINLSGINGGTLTVKVEGELKRAGAANVNASFNQVGMAKINTGGYPSGHDDWGNVNIRLADNCNDVGVYVYYASSANSSARFDYSQNDMKISDEYVDTPEAKAAIVNNIVVSGGTTGTLEIISQNRVYLS